MEPGNKQNTGRWKKGESGNKSGRPKVPKELQSRIRSVFPEVIEFWIETMKDETARVDYRLRASENLADRAYGKAPQQVDANIETHETVDISKLSKKDKEGILALAILQADD